MSILNKWEYIWSIENFKVWKLLEHFRFEEWFQTWYFEQIYWNKPFYLNVEFLYLTCPIKMYFSSNSRHKISNTGCDHVSLTQINWKTPQTHFQSQSSKKTKLFLNSFHLEVSRFREEMGWSSHLNFLKVFIWLINVNPSQF